MNSQSLCAERSALTQLRMLPFSKIMGLYIVSDLIGQKLTPGMVCREFLCEFLESDTPIYLASLSHQLKMNVNDNVNGLNGTHSTNGIDVENEYQFTHRLTTLQQLYPHPSLFVHIRGSSMIEFVESLVKKSEKIEHFNGLSDQQIKLYKEIIKQHKSERCVRLSSIKLSPVRLCAGVLFDDGSSATTSQNLLCEFAHSLDCVVKLMYLIEDKYYQNVNVSTIIICDQFGLCHSPSASARAHLFESGFINYQNCKFIFHNINGKINLVNLSELVIDIPALDQIDSAKEQCR